MDGRKTKSVEVPWSISLYVLHYSPGTVARGQWRPLLPVVTFATRFKVVKRWMITINVRMNK